MRFIAFIVFSLLCLPAFARSVEFEGKQVREYTKEWTGDYYTKHKVVYHGYRGDDNYHQGEFEIWHGPAVFYSMGRKALEGTYRNGKRMASSPCGHSRELKPKARILMELFMEK